jgi:hypothetical protein
MQTTLNRAIGAALPVDGVMSASVRDAIREFQRRNRLPASGYVGPDTEAALRRVGGGAESRELEFEWEFELTGEAKAVDNALSWERAQPYRMVLKKLGKTAIKGIYRFYAPDRRFYTGMATDLRRRIIQHVWCLSHLGAPTEHYKLVCKAMDKSPPEIREIERAINKHNMKFRFNESLNKRAELEILELENL